MTRLSGEVHHARPHRRFSGGNTRIRNAVFADFGRRTKHRHEIRPIKFFGGDSCAKVWERKTVTFGNETALYRLTARRKRNVLHG
ncbi:MAG: hypothetical protein EBU67_09950 [Actinobacteria bacterium]|nr:hypothetical protein [Actinomycetota bacterium]NBP54582.1 hypothetical protein [Actinomycetota bacterium]